MLANNDRVMVTDCNKQGPGVGVEVGGWGGGGGAGSPHLQKQCSYDWQAIKKGGGGGGRRHLQTRCSYDGKDHKNRVLKQLLSVCSWQAVARIEKPKGSMYIPTS